MNKEIKNRKGVALPSAPQRDRAGMTLVEVLVAVALLALMAGAIYSAGFAVLRHAQAVTITTAAHTYAKEGLEEMISAGYDTLTGGEPIEQVILMNPNTHKVDLTRRASVIWHASDGTTSSDPVAGGYAEIIVQVFWQVPRTDHVVSTGMSTLLY